MIRTLTAPLAALAQVVGALVVLQAAACATAPVVVAKQEPLMPLGSLEQGELDALSAQGPLFFETDSEELTMDSRDLLKRVAAEMFKQPRTKLVVIGHADERGDTSYNLALGERRGHAARQFLVRMGMPAGRVKVISLGEEQPIADGHNDDSWSMNRRDEFGFITPSQATASADGEVNLGLESRLLND